MEYVKGKQVAFEDLKVGQWYFDESKLNLFKVVYRSEFQREVAIDTPEFGISYRRVGDVPFFEAIEKKEPTVHRRWVNFRRSPNGQIITQLYDTAANALQAATIPNHFCGEYIGTAIAELAENPE